MKKIWYDKEANVWEEALPLGNGRLGAMVFSGAFCDRLQVNEETLWSGFPYREPKKHSLDELAPIRKLIRDGKYYEATKATSDIMSGMTSAAYVNYGSIFVEISCERPSIDAFTVSNYRRELDLECGVCRSEFKFGNINIKKEYFVSLKDDVLIIHISSDSPIEAQMYNAVELESRTFSEGLTVFSEGRCPTKVSTYPFSIEYGEEETVHFRSGIKFLCNGEIYGAATLFGLGRLPRSRRYFHCVQALMATTKCRYRKERNIARLVFKRLRRLVGLGMKRCLSGISVNIESIMTVSRCRSAERISQNFRLINGLNVLLSVKTIMAWRCYCLIMQDILQYPLRKKTVSR